MSPSRIRFVRRALHWAPAGATVVLAPKCAGCLALYLGVGTLFGLRLGGPEMCGASAALPAGAVVWLAATVALVLVGARRGK